MSAPRLKLINSRKDMEMTQEILAEKVGISRAYLANIEAGKHDPSLTVMSKISRLLNKTVDDLFL